MAIGKIKRPIQRELPKTQQEYIANAENYLTQTTFFDPALLKNLSLDELVQRYKDIDQQSQLFKGQILLEARERFQSNIEFGKWLSVNFTELNSSNTGKLINLARFFQGERTLDGIPVSAGYLLAAPSNKDFADKVYTKIKDKNLKLDEIKMVLEQYKKSNSHTTKAVRSKSDGEDADNDISMFAAHLLNHSLAGKTNEFKRAVLTEALRQLKNNTN
jgi:hypothetical protein